MSTIKQKEEEILLEKLIKALDSLDSGEILKVIKISKEAFESLKKQLESCGLSKGNSITVLKARLKIIEAAISHYCHKKTINDLNT